MAESAKHMEYVQNIVDYIKINFDCCNGILMADLPNCSGRPYIGSAEKVPDVLFYSNNVSIIGEAKTVNDVDNWHTEAQLNSYIEYLRMQSKDRHLVIYTSWLSLPTIKNKMRLLKAKEDFPVISIHLLSEIESVIL